MGESAAGRWWVSGCVSEVKVVQSNSRVVSLVWRVSVVQVMAHQHQGLPRPRARDETLIEQRRVISLSSIVALTPSHLRQVMG